MKKIIEIENNYVVIFDRFMFSCKHVFIMMLGIITIFTFFLTNSFAIFTKLDHLTNVSFIAGDLNYTLESIILDDGKVTVNSKNEYLLTVTLTSLNDMDTKYELYYLVNGKKQKLNNLTVTYTTDSVDSVSGVIGAGKSKEITVNIANYTDESVEIEIGCEGGLISNDLVMSKGLKIGEPSDDTSTVLLYSYVGEDNAPSKFPEKSDGYYIQDLTCTGGEATWNNETWAMEVESTTGKTLRCVAQVTDLYNDASGSGSPDIDNNMIPVIYDKTTATWVKADVKSKWYDYDNKMWANAVTVNEESRNKYVMADAGTTISMKDINAMWVWIPRFEYKSITSNTVTEIKVKFLGKNESDKTDGYVTHPAFKLGDNLAGFWVGKFETSSNKTCYPNYGSTGDGCDMTDLSPMIIPNTSSWRGIRVSTAFMVSSDMTAANNIYGFSSDKIDSHMMKNTEWGAVAYLSQSKYGRCTDGICEEIMLNNNTDYITGIAADNSSTGGNDSVTNKYNTDKGQRASTTGNVYGVYDMSGGAYEYVMGVMENASKTKTLMSGYSVSSNSGFKSTLTDNQLYTGSSRGIPDSKYYDLYSFSTENNTSSSYNRYIKGDATKETLKWNDDNADFINNENPWFHRGGTYYEYGGAGIFNFGRNTGQAHGMITFRVVLSNK